MSAAKVVTLFVGILSLACGQREAENELEQSAREFFFREAVRRGRLESGAGAGTTVCVATMPNHLVRPPPSDSLSDPAPAFLERLTATDPRVRPSSACGQDSVAGGPPNWGLLVRERSTGAAAILVWVGPVLTIGSDQATATIGYREHGLSAAGWQCGAVRSEAQWRITRCDGVWQS